MKIYRPLRDNVLVEMLAKEERLSTGIVLPDAPTLRWIRLKVLGVGPEVNDKLQVGQVVLAENMVEKVDIEDSKTGVILAKYIHVIEQEAPRVES